MPELAQVFEYDTLKVGEQGFTPQHFDALVRYNDKHGSKFFTVGHKRLRFGSYVGVIQVGSLSIEILPKAEEVATADKGKWQRALLQMLRQSGHLKVESFPEASLHTRRSALLDLYIDSFLTEVASICHAGLVKKYRLTEGNLTKFKGRILFHQQITQNLLHRERMYTSHQIYDPDNAFNRILKCALGIINKTSRLSSITSRASALKLLFERVSDSRIPEETFERLRLDRNTQRYSQALQLARLIILNFSPDLRAGTENILAILFDMNVLFEQFIFASLRRAQDKLGSDDFQIEGQASRPFWSSKSIRPDIVVNFNRGILKERVILDTKWKIPKGNQPSDADLKQIYSYNLHFGSSRGILLYPSASESQADESHPFVASLSLDQDHSHSCATHFIKLFDQKHNLRKDIGASLLKNLTCFSKL